jgi:hypothetical protein
MNGSSWTILRAMFWKECRENCGWALLGALGLTLGILYGVVSKGSGYSFSIKNVFDFWRAFSVAMMFGCVLIAAALGFLQVLPERRRDQWAFLFHRPASPGALFWGKALAGLALYLLATLVPLIAVGVWAATPGNMVAPFDARLLLSGIVAVFSGSIAYFGALISASRSARWYGSRALPAIIGALLAFAGPTACTEFRPGMIQAAVFAAVYAAAAWGVFGAGGEGARRPWAGKIALSIVLCAAFTALYTLAISGAGAAYQALAPARRIASYEQYGLSHSGVIVRGRYVDDTSRDGRAAVRLASVSDVNGRPLPKQTDHYDRQYDRYQWPTTVGGWDSRYSYEDPRRYLQTVHTYRETHAPDVGWYYLARERRIAIYGLLDRRLAGWFGVDGFAPIGAPMPAPFPGEPVLLPDVNQQMPSIYLFTHDIYRLDAFDSQGRFLDIAQRKMTHIRHMAKDAAIVSVMPLSQIGAEGLDGFVMKTSQGVEVIDARGAQIFLAPWARGEDGVHTQVDMAAVLGHEHSSDKYLIRFASWGGRWMRCVVVEPGGKVLQQATLPNPTYAANTQPPAAAGLLVPPAGIPLVYNSSADGGQPATPAILAASFAFGLLWAALAWGVGARCAAERRVRIAWSVLCYLFGLPGLLTLLAMRAWPPRVSCPQCGQKRVVSRERCEHCHAAFSEPKRDGTEIFDGSRLALRGEEAA